MWLSEENKKEEEKRNKTKYREKKTPTNDSIENNTENTAEKRKKKHKQCELIYGDASKSDKRDFACFRFSTERNSCAVLCLVLIFFFVIM